MYTWLQTKKGLWREGRYENIRIEIDCTWLLAMLPWTSCLENKMKALSSQLKKWKQEYWLPCGPYLQFHIKLMHYSLMKTLNVYYPSSTYPASQQHKYENDTFSTSGTFTDCLNRKAQNYVHRRMHHWDLIKEQLKVRGISGERWG